MIKFLKTINNLISILLVVTITAGFFAENITAVQVSYKTAIQQTAKLFLSQSVPTSGTTDGEWKLIGLVRSDVDVPKSYTDGYYSNVSKIVEEAKGELSTRKYTEYSRAILGITATGRDARSVSGYDLVSPLADYEKVTTQTINGTAWALIALDSNNYDIPKTNAKTQTTRSLLVQHIINGQFDDGGWAIMGSKGDIDITAMIITSLAPYYKENSVVKASVDRGVQFLSKNQNDSGAYTSWGIDSSESISQTIVALCALGINPNTDSRFIKNGNSLVEALLKFYTDGGGFSHTKGDRYNQISAEQGLYALVAYQRFLEGKTSLFDMTDLYTKPKDTKNEISSKPTVHSTTEHISVTEKNKSKNSKSTKSKSSKSNNSNKNSAHTSSAKSSDSDSVSSSSVEKRSEINDIVTSSTEPYASGKKQTDKPNDSTENSSQSSTEKNSPKNTTEKTIEKNSDNNTKPVLKENSLENFEKNSVVENTNRRKTIIFIILAVLALAIVAFLIIKFKKI